MTRGQFNMFAEEDADFASFDLQRRAGRRQMHTDLYLQTKSYHLKHGWKAQFMPHCEVRSALILMLVEPCVTPSEVSRLIEFILADNEAMQLLKTDCGLQRILLSALLPMKSTSEEIYSTAVSMLSEEFCFDSERDEFRDFIVSLLEFKGA